MPEKKNECQALIKWEPPLIEKLDELRDKRRHELEEALRSWQVGDPISSILISIAISAAISAASYGLSLLLAPKPKQQRVGELQGTLQLQNSEQGIFIPEIYGAGPTVTPVAGVVPTYQNVTNSSVGAGGAITKNAGAAGTWDAHATSTASIVNPLNARVKWTMGVGPLLIGFSTVANPSSPADIIFGLLCNTNTFPSGQHVHAIQPVISGVQQPDLSGLWNAGDILTVELRDGRFKGFIGEREFTIPNVPVATWPLWPCVFMHDIGTGPTALTIITDGNLGDPPNQGVGGCKVPALIIYTSGLRKHETPVQQQQQSGGKGHAPTQTMIQVSYDLDLALQWGLGPLDLIRLYANADILLNLDPHLEGPTLVYDPTEGADANYTPNTLPDPNDHYLKPLDRMNAALIELEPGDPGGGHGGPIQGGSSQLAIYHGTVVQNPDPTIEAAIDSIYGVGSTSAYRYHAYTVHAAFKLDRWQGIVPNFTAAWQHQTLKTLGPIFGSWCLREGLIGADFDTVSADDINVRGLLLASSRYSPAAVMDSVELQALYNYFTTEGDGKIWIIENGDEPSITIPEADFGWLDGQSDIPDLVQTITVQIANEDTLSRLVNFKYVDPGNDWDPNVQSDQRKIIAGREARSIEVSATAIPDEARAAAQRALYNEYVASTTYKFTLPWTYMYLYPGYKIITTLSAGFTYTFRLTSISGGAGLLECEAVALEIEAFTQPATGATPPDFNPGQVIPAMTIAVPLNLPSIRQTDLGPGFDIGGRPRTGVSQGFKGYTLWKKLSNDWKRMFPPITGVSVIGKIVSATDLYADENTVDIVFTVNAATDVFTSTGHALVNGQAVVSRNTGGGLPAPLVAGTTYYVRDADTFLGTFKLAATLGGSAINITSAGTGTNFLNAGQIVVDLYGDGLLASVTKAEMIAGANRAAVGDLVVGFADAVQDPAFPNRWTLSTLLTGQNQTEGHTTDTLTNKAFVLLDESVQFIPIDESDIGTSMILKAVTFGQSLIDAAEITFICTGETIKPSKPTNLVAVPDLSANWHAKMIGSPKVDEEPASYIMRVRRFSDGVLMRDIPVSPSGGTSFAAAFSNKSGGGSVVNNNVYPGVTGFAGDETYALTAQEITGPGSFIEFIASIEFNTLNWQVDLIPSSHTPWNDGLGQEYRVQVFAGTPVQGDHLFIVTERFGEIIFSSRLRSPAKIRMAFVGSQVRFYVDWINANSKPLAVGTRPLTFPLKARVFVTYQNKVESMIIGGLEEPQTIYSSVQQAADNLNNGGTAVPLNDITIEAWQTSPIPVINNKGFSTKATRFKY